MYNVIMCLRGHSQTGSGQIEALSYHFKRNKAYVANIEDIYDGLQYRKLADLGGPLWRPFLSLSILMVLAHYFTQLSSLSGPYTS